MYFFTDSLLFIIVIIIICSMSFYQWVLFFSSFFSILCFEPFLTPSCPVLLILLILLVLLVLLLQRHLIKTDIMRCKLVTHLAGVGGSLSILPLGTSLSYVLCQAVLGEAPLSRLHVPSVGTKHSLESAPECPEGAEDLWLRVDRWYVLLLKVVKIVRDVRCLLRCHGEPLKCRVFLRGYCCLCGGGGGVFFSSTLCTFYVQLSFTTERERKRERDNTKEYQYSQSITLMREKPN